jgi:hypothetical protein
MPLNCDGNCSKTRKEQKICSSKFCLGSETFTSERPRKLTYRKYHNKTYKTKIKNSKTKTQN